MLCCGHSTDNDFSCEVILLDDTVLPFRNNIHFKKNAKVQGIFDAVCDHLNLAETEYFGLHYVGNGLQTHWLDLYRAFKDHEGLLSGESPHKLYFGVKFFVADPTGLKEEITRYQFFLQLKRDVLSGTLPCEFKKATELAALALQSELGDYRKGDCPPGYASEFRFISNQDEEFENEAERLHADYSGLVPAEAEMIYLRKCRQLDMYGLDVHSVQDESGAEYVLGLSARGIEMRKNRRKVRTHYWALISGIEFKDRQLRIQVKNKNFDDSVYTFLARDRASAKYLWKRAIEQHEFFRLMPECGAPASSQLSKKFRYSGRSGSERHLEDGRKEPEVIRSRSKRYPSRTRRNKENGGKSKQDEDRSVRQAENTTTETNNVVAHVDRQTNGTNENLMTKAGLFSSTTQGGIDTNYITPKNERRQRNRQLHSLSDSENKRRKSRSRHGRSSGEDSDGPSKRRLRARNNRMRQGGPGSAEPTSTPRRRLYHTDTEMIDSNTIWKQPRNQPPDTLEEAGSPNTVRNMTDGGRSDTQSNRSRQRRNRRKQNRLSREDATAQQVLWQHIQQEQQDPEKYTPQQLQDIPYTEVKTEGNPLPIKLRRHSRGSSSPSHRRTSRSSANHERSRKGSSSTAIGEGLVSPLPVTTTISRDGITMGGQGGAPRYYQGKQRAGNPPANMQDWDTRTRRTNGSRGSHGRHRSKNYLSDNSSYVSYSTPDKNNRNTVNLNHSTASTQV